MDPGRTLARRASIRLVPPEDEDPFVEPSKSQSDIATTSNAFLPPDPGLIASQTGQESFRFGFTSPEAHSPPSPALGESALSPPEVSKSRFSSSTVVSPERARISSYAVPWHPPANPTQSRFSTDTSSPEISGRLLPPAAPQPSRFSGETSSQVSTSSTESPPERSFSPTVGGESSPETPRFLTAPRTHFSTTTITNPPQLPAPIDQPEDFPQNPPTPSQWQSFFSPARPQYSRFSASTTSPPEASPPSPPSSAGSTSSSSSMDGTALPEIPDAVPYSQPNARLYSSSSGRYSHPFPTTDLSVIDEDEAYQEDNYSSSPLYPPPIPRRSSSRPISAERDHQTPESPGRSTFYAGTAAAVAYAAGTLSPPQPAHYPSMLPNSRKSVSFAPRPRSGAPQIPPLPPFNHSTESLQRYFRYFPTPNLNDSPVVGSAFQPGSPGSSVVTFGSVTGPNGERFSAIREKRQSRGVYWADGTHRKRRVWIRGMTWKLWLIVILIAFLAMATLAIGLGVGLSMADDGNDDQNQNGENEAGNETNARVGNVGDSTLVFPAGTYSITTNLFNVSTACTNISSTWTCPPGLILQTGGLNASQSGLVWTVTQNNITNEREDNGGFSISSAINPFTLQFNSTPLTLREQGTENEHWGFETRVNKRVRPNGAIPGTGAAVDCNYSQAKLTGRLFTRRQPDPQFVDGPGSWPGAVEAEESSEIEGECFETRNGLQGARVNIGVGPGVCTCIYGDSIPG